MDDQTVAGLPGPCHKLTATGWSPAAWEILAAHSALFTYLYIKRLLYGPVHVKSPCFGSTKFACVSEKELLEH